MKKYIEIYLIVLMVCFLLIGCVSNKFTYDETIPQEEQSELQFSATMKVIKFNGNDVNWRTKSYSGTIIVNIPAGNHYLVCYYSDGSWYTDNMTVTYNFLPMKTYKLDTFFEGREARAIVKELKK